MASYSLTFLTDYGIEDGFIAACHGVCATIAPNTRIIDITHLIPPGDIRRGAAVLAQTVPYFPAAVHVAVVDPGVGTARRGVAIAAANGHIFVGPDNGLLTWAVEKSGGPSQSVTLTNRTLWRSETVPATFHGRDIFIPVAARLATGTKITEAGGSLNPAALVTLPDPFRRVRAGTAEAEVLTIDHFGNIQLSLTTEDAQAVGLTLGTTARLTWTSGTLTAPVRETFGQVPQGTLVLYIDSAGHVSLALNGGNAAKDLDLPTGTRVSCTADSADGGRRGKFLPGLRLADGPVKIIHPSLSSVPTVQGAPSHQTRTHAHTPAQTTPRWPPSPHRRRSCAPSPAAHRRDARIRAASRS